MASSKAVIKTHGYVEGGKDMQLLSNAYASAILTSRKAQLWRRMKAETVV